MSRKVLSPSFSIWGVWRAIFLYHMKIVRTSGFRLSGPFTRGLVAEAKEIYFGQIAIRKTRRGQTWLIASAKAWPCQTYERYTCLDHSFENRVIFSRLRFSTPAFLSKHQTHGNQTHQNPNQIKHE